MQNSINPSNYEVLGSVELSTTQQIESSVINAKNAQKQWGKLSYDERIVYLSKLHSILEKNSEKLITLTSQEMGMPKGLSQIIVKEGISKLKWNCNNVKEMLKTEIIHEDDNEINKRVYEPYGVVACIMAWNFPLANFIANTSQFLLAGNTIVVKYSEEIPLFSKFLEELINLAELPDGVINFIYGGGEAGETLLKQNIDFIVFTGSSNTGRKIYAKAAEKLIPVALELGGSSPGIVFEDCQLNDKIIESIFWKRFDNSAQFCDGLKRLIVHESLYNKVISGLTKYANNIILGDPLDETTNLGPLVAKRQVEKLKLQLQDALDKGAKIEIGGKEPTDLNGAYFEPTILTNISKDMQVWNQEVFGPILPVISFKTYNEAIELANDTEYGLSAFIFTESSDIFNKASSDINAGSIDDGKSHFYHSESPFGGFKASGIGRLYGKEGFLTATQTKVIATAK